MGQDQDNKNEAKKGAEIKRRHLGVTGRRLADRKAFQAEYSGSATLDDIIAQLRSRARRSALSARILLGFLLFSVLAGLFFYLALPFINTYFDGKKLTLEASAEALTDSLSAYQTERESLPQRVVDALADVNSSVPRVWPKNTRFDGAIKTDDGDILVWGRYEQSEDSSGVLLRYDPSSGTAEPIELDWKKTEFVSHALALGTDAILLVGDEGSLRRYEVAGHFMSTVDDAMPNEAYFQGAVLVEGGDALIWGSQENNGSRAAFLTRLNPANNTNNPVNLDWGEREFVDNILALGSDEILLTSDAGATLSYSVSQHKVSKPSGIWPKGFRVNGTLQAEDNITLIWGFYDGDESLRSFLMRRDSLQKANTIIDLDWNDSEDVTHVGNLGAGRFYLIGHEGSLFQYELADDFATEFSGSLPDMFDTSGALQASESIVLLWGILETETDLRSILYRIDTSTQSITEVTGDWSQQTLFSDAVQLSDEKVLIWGADEDEVKGLLLEYHIENDSVSVVDGDWPPETYFRSTFKVRDGSLLVLGDEGTLFEYPKLIGFQMPAETIASDDEFRASVLGISNRLRDRSQIKSVVNRVTALSILREDDSKQLAVTNATLKVLENRFLALAEKRDNFAEFMNICRGLSGPDYRNNLIGDANSTNITSASDNKGGKSQTTNPVKPSGAGASKPDAITLACTQAWQADLAAQTGNWWQTLAIQVPPGILLLFLLATLGGLYRHSVRMAGFHSSRADVLELVLLTIDGNTAMFGKSELDIILSLSDALGADKVDFANTKTPIDQAVDLARAIAKN